MIEVRRGGSGSTTLEDREERFVPIHPKVAAHLNPLRKSGPISRAVCERKLPKRSKKLCTECGFESPQQYKLHTFHHDFGLCAKNNVAYRKALTWLGHSSSQMLKLYYHVHDEDSQKAMAALAADEFRGGLASAPNPEGNLRATRGSRIEDSAQVPELQQLVSCIEQSAKRAGFEPAVRGTVHTLYKRGP